jgi:hypothetical protein
LYVATADGVASPGSARLDPARVNEASVRQWALCARLAVALEQREPYKAWGEPRLRAAERHAGEPVASAERSTLPDGRPRSRRPDLVLFPDAALPVAVEVELSVKAAGPGGHLPGVGALPARQRGPLLRAAARRACRFSRARARRHPNPESR